MYTESALREKLQGLREEVRRTYSDYDLAMKSYSEFELLKIHMDRAKKKSTLTK